MQISESANLHSIENFEWENVVFAKKNLKRNCCWNIDCRFQCYLSEFLQWILNRFQIQGSKKWALRFKLDREYFCKNVDGFYSKMKKRTVIMFEYESNEKLAHFERIDWLRSSTNKLVRVITSDHLRLIKISYSVLIEFQLVWKFHVKITHR